MRILKHEVITEYPPREEWGTMDLKNKIFMDAPENFLYWIRDEIDMSDNYGSYGDSGYYYYSVKSNNYDYCDTVVATQTTNMTLFDLELHLIVTFTFDADKLVNPDLLAYHKGYHNRYSAMKKSEKEVESKKTIFKNSIALLMERQEVLKVYDEKFKQFELNGIKNGVWKYVVKNVTAEDTNASGEDIYLGDLEFTVSFITNTVTLTGGSHERDNEYNRKAFHPHHLSNMICLGTQEADFVEACEKMEFDFMKIMLKKFAESYTSSDSAGKYWVQWSESETADKYRRDTFDNMVRESDMVMGANGLEYSINYCNETNRGWVYNDDTVYSDYHDVYYHEDDAIYSNELSSHILREDAVELENGRGWMPRDHDDVIEYDGDYYHDGDMVTDINGDSVPENLCYYSNDLSAHILKEDAVYHDETNDYYTAETLPSDDEEEDEVTEDEVIEEVQVVSEVPEPLIVESAQIETSVEEITVANPTEQDTL